MGFFSRIPDNEEYDQSNEDFGGDGDEELVLDDEGQHVAFAIENCVRFST
jgi:hypothetical protein